MPPVSSHNVLMTSKTHSKFSNISSWSLRGRPGKVGVARMSFSCSVSKTRP